MVAFTLFGSDPKSPGGGIQGWMPQQTQLVDKSYPNYEQIRFTLKQAWNTHYRGQGVSQPMCGPFRAVNNAGDLLSRNSYSCGGTCQTYQSRPGLHGLRGKFGAVSTSCVPSVTYNSLQLLDTVPAGACNGKYVYDSSDYTRFRKQEAVNKNYNDYTYGGDQSKASQHAQRAIRRY